MVENQQRCTGTFKESYTHGIYGGVPGTRLQSSGKPVSGIPTEVDLLSMRHADPAHALEAARITVNRRDEGCGQVKLPLSSRIFPHHVCGRTSRQPGPG